MIKYELEAQAQLTRQHIIGLLQKIKLCKAQAKNYVEVCKLNDNYIVYIPTLALHSYCVRYKKYKSNESLKDLVLNLAESAKLSQADTDLLIEAITT